MFLLRTLFLIAFGYIILYPLIYMVSASVKAEIDFLDPTVNWMPKHFSIEAFDIAIQSMNIPDTLINTVVVEMVSVVLCVVSCSVAAYGMARFEFKEKKLLTALLYLLILVPPQLVVIPTFMNFKNLDFLGILKLIGDAVGTELRINILDTPFSIYLPSLFGVGLKAGVIMYIFIRFYKGLPKELEEAAFVDGAGPWCTFLRIIVPSAGVVFVTNFILATIWYWNDYYLAVMYTPGNPTFALALSNIFQGMSIVVPSEGSLIARSVSMAGCLLFIAPVLLFYLIMQRKFIQSVDRVGIVG